MKTVISKSEYEEIYRMLDKVSPVDYDCGRLCGAVCCTCSYEPDDMVFTADGDENANSYMGLYLLPGEEALFNMDPASPKSDCNWIDWGCIMAEDYEFPESWTGKVHFIQCKTAPLCRRDKRPIQCRTFPLAPHIDEKGGFHMILNCDDLPYDCPLISENSVYGGSIVLSDDFVDVSFSAWKRLLKDAQIRDLVAMDSKLRIEDDADIQILK